MYKIFFATRARGFFKHLMNEQKIKWKIVSQDSLYEVNSKKRIFLSKVFRSKFFDFLGIINVKKCNRKDVDGYLSFNRFLNTNLPYIIYLENPTALYHYSLNRKKSILGKKIISENLENKNLKTIICMSKACYSTIDSVCGEVCSSTDLKVIYPLVPKNQLINEEKIKMKSTESELKLLYISQGIRFVSKGGLEVIESFKQLKELNMEISLTIITSIEDLNSELVEKVKNIDGISLINFSFSYSELEHIYSTHHILIHPTSDDSFGLTVLEAMKAGLPVISTRLYAIPEMVEEGINGFLIEPKYWFFDENNIPNPKVWNNRRNTIYSQEIDSKIVNFIKEKIYTLAENRKLLEEISLNSYRKSNRAPFDEETIIKQWNSVLEKSFQQNN